jgi:hypothetical protein
MRSLDENLAEWTGPAPNGAGLNFSGRGRGRGASDWPKPLLTAALADEDIEAKFLLEKVS